MAAVAFTVWTGDEWVDTSLPGVGSDFGQVEAEGLFLKLDASNDPVTGTCEFAEGVSVTGGDPNTIGTGIVKDGANLDIINSGILCFQAYANGGALFGQTTADTGSLDLSYSGGDVSHTVSNLYGLREQLVFNAGASITDAFSFYASALNNGGTTANYTGFGVASAPSASKNFGFRSDINKEGGKDNYGFYALGSAPNYFFGETKIGHSEHYGEFAITNGSSVTRCLNMVRTGDGPVGMKAITVSNTDDGEVFSVDYSGFNNTRWWRHNM